MSHYDGHNRTRHGQSRTLSGDVWPDRHGQVYINIPVLSGHPGRYHKKNKTV